MYNSDNTVQFETSNLACRSFFVGIFRNAGAHSGDSYELRVAPSGGFKGKGPGGERVPIFFREIKRWFAKNELSVQEKIYWGWMRI